MIRTNLTSHVPGLTSVLSSNHQETVFEKRRGVSAVEIQQGYTSVHIDHLTGCLAKERIKILEIIANKNISIQFLKLTLNGLAFVIQESDIPKVQDALHPYKKELIIYPSRSIVLVYAVNMRDEEGLIAEIVSIAITNQIKMNHLSDMHDRLLILTDAQQASLLAHSIKQEMMEKMC